MTDQEILTNDELKAQNKILENQVEVLKIQNKKLEREKAILIKQIEILCYFSKNLSDEAKETKLNEFLAKFSDEYTKKYYRNSYEQLKWD